MRWDTEFRLSPSVQKKAGKANAPVMSATRRAAPRSAWARVVGGPVLASISLRRGLSFRPWPRCRWRFTGDYDDVRILSNAASPHQRVPFCLRSHAVRFVNYV